MPGHDAPVAGGQRPSREKPGYDKAAMKSAKHPKSNIRLLNSIQFIQSFP
jgi:hypothetical protein